VTVLRAVDLSLGDPGYGPPEQAVAAGARAILRGVGGYAPPGGLRKLRAAAAAKLRERNGIRAEADEVVVTTGASLGLFASLATLCRPGDRVLLPDPCFPLYRRMVATLRLEAVPYPLVAAEYAPDWDALQALARGARVLLWNYPSNPLGAVARRAWLERLFAVMAGAPDLTLVSDEVYEALVFDGAHVSPAAWAGELRDRVLSVFSFSKSHGMTGWRVGYVHAPGALARAVAMSHWGVSMSTPTTAQIAALAALGAPATYLEERRALLLANRDQAVARLRGAGVACEVPAAGFFLWGDISRFGLDAEAFAERCAAEAGTLVSPGTDFSPVARDRVRLSFALDRQRLLEGLARLHAWTGGLAARAGGRAV